MVRPAILTLLALTAAGCVFDRGGLPVGPLDLGSADRPLVDQAFSERQVTLDLADAASDAGADVAPGPDGLPDGPVPDGPSPDAVLPDTTALADLVPADTLPTSTFGAVTVIAALSSPDSEDDPTLTADMLEIFFDSSRPGGKGGGEIWTSTRSSLTAPWSTPKPVAVLNSTDSETTPEVAPDGLTIYFTSYRAGGKGNGDIYVATRPNRTAAWSLPTYVAALSSTDGDFAPTTSDDQLFMVMSSTRPGAGDFDLYTTSRAQATSPWSAPAPITVLNTSSVETDPWFNEARTVLYFSTNRPGGKGGWDIWRTIRSSATSTFAAPSPVPELNSAQDDGDVWLSPDMKVIYLSSSRDGDSDLYMATRP